MSQCSAILLSRDIVLRYESIVKLLKKFSTKKSEHAEKSPYLLVRILNLELIWS